MCPSFFFGSPLYTLSPSVVLNSSLSSRTYLFCSLEKRSPKSNESRNVQQLACAILKCVNSLISSLFKPARNVTCAQYFTAFIEHKHWKQPTVKRSKRQKLFFAGKAHLKINSLVKTRLHEFMAVARSGLWAPVIT